MPIRLSEHGWPPAVPAVQVRIARPTDKLDEIRAFYCDLLGLTELHRGTGAGYRILMIGLPDDRYHLEFTSHEDGSPGTAPTEENLLVLYFATASDRDGVADRLRAAGVDEVDLDNPWWAENGAVSFADPDGWRITLMPTAVPIEGRPEGPFRADDPLDDQDEG